MEELMEVLHLNNGLSSEGELAWGQDLIKGVLGLSSAARDVLVQIYTDGPTHDGNVVSKMGRDELLKHDFISKICLAKGEEGYQALTYRGAWAFKVHMVAAKPKDNA